MPDFSSFFLGQLNNKAAEISRSLDISPSTRNEILCRSSTIMKHGSRSGHISIHNIDLVSEHVLAERSGTDGSRAARPKSNCLRITMTIRGHGNHRWS